MGKTKKLISWNVNGLRAIEKKGFVDIVNQLNPDILAIQETKVHLEQIPSSVKPIMGYEDYWCCADKKGYSGTGVYTRIPPLAVFNGMNNHEFDQEGRCITLEFDTFYFVNLYFPNAQEKLKRISFKIAFNNHLLSYVNELKRKKTVVVCGDYNVAHKEIDLKNPKGNEKNPGFSIQERNWMDQFIQAGYVDTFRQFHPEPGHYTWWSYRFNARQKDIGWRIDYFCINQENIKRVKSATIFKTIMGSDHCPIGIEFE